MLGLVEGEFVLGFEYDIFWVQNTSNQTQVLESKQALTSISKLDPDPNINALVRIWGF